MKKKLVLGCLFFLSLSCQTAKVDRNISLALRRDLKWGGLDRYFLLFKPKNFENSHPSSRKIMMLIHGGGGTADRMSEYTGYQLEKLAEESNHTLIVYPNGYKKGWNDGRSTDSIESQKETIDDVGFLTHIFSELSVEFKIPPRNVFVGGVSNGGFMSYRIGCDKSQFIGGIANVVGSLAEDYKSKCNPKLPFSIISITGTADPLNPFNGGEVRGVLGFSKRGKSYSTENTLKFFGEKFGCGKQGIDSVTLPDVSRTDGSTVKLIRWKCTNSNLKIHQYVVVDGGHQWPGGYVLFPSLLGSMNNDISASKVIFEFFDSIKFQNQ